MRRRGAAMVLALGTTLLAADPARAADPVARQRFTEGARAFAAKEWVAAATAFEDAARREPHPAPLVNAAEAWEHADQPERAAAACDRALTLTLTSNERESVSLRLLRLVPRVGTLDVSGATHLNLRVDDGEPITPPSRTRVRPGPHTLTLVDGASRRTRPITVHAGETQTLVLPDAFTERAPAPAPFPIAPSPSPHPDVAQRPAAEGRARVPTGAVVALTVAGLGLGTGGVFGFLTSQARDDFEANPTLDTRDTFYRNRTITNAALGVGAVAAVTALVLWLVNPREPARAARTE